MVTTNHRTRRNANRADAEKAPAWWTATASTRYTVIAYRASAAPSGVHLPRSVLSGRVLCISSKRPKAYS